MKRTAVILCALLLAVGLCACKKNGVDGVKGSYTVIPYSDGTCGSLYDTDLFWRNDQHAATPDPGVLYVPEEREGGGYYYMYTTEITDVNGAAEDSEISRAAFWVMRSRDLNDWELCGAVNNGYALAVTGDTWAESRFWAPECYYAADEGAYYLYFTAASRQGDETTEYSASAVTAARTYIGVARSSSPAGPFEYVTGQNLDELTLTRSSPQINFKKALDLDYDFGVIDVHLFDDEGTLHMYFCESRNVPRPGGTASVGGIWTVVMKDWVTPDYDTLTLLTEPGVKTVTRAGSGGIHDTYTRTGEFSTAQGALIPDEGGINEGPFMVRHKDKYYLTYSQGGYTSRNYSVWQAVGDSPVGPFTKLEADEGGLVLGAGAENDWLVGSAHHCITYAGGEPMIVYHGHLNPLNYTDTDGRGIAVDRVRFVDGGNGYDVMAANGPSKSLQYKPESISGYKNLAMGAAVSVTGGIGGETYLTDGYYPSHEAFSGGWEYRSAGKTTVTLTFGKPVDVSSVMVYNSRQYAYAFSEIDSIAFRLAEKPEWFHTAADYAVIENLPFPQRYYSELEEFMRAGGAAVAVFRPMLVTEITLTVSDKLADTGDGEIRVADIVVLGREAKA